MGKINWGRVILGGLLAGVVINIGEFVLNEIVVKAEWVAAAAALGLPTEESSRQMVVWLLYGFALGIFAVWGYAAIRPRYGAGPKTAICAGSAVWFAACALFGVIAWNIGLFPTPLIAKVTLWELVEIPLATVVGAWLYKES
jgi:hypothetical protein